MAQEPAEAPPLMTPVQIAHQNDCDMRIRRNHCTFLSRIHLLPPLRDIMTWEGVYSVPSDHVNEFARFSEFFTNDVKLQIVGNGLECTAIDPQGNFTSLIVNLDANGAYNFRVAWMELLYQSQMKETGVLSMWGFNENGKPTFIFRHDRYAGVGEELPPLMDMTQQGQDGCCNSCNVS